MLASITPVGEQARHSRWALTAGAYLLGSIVGGAATGALLGGVGGLLAATLAIEARLTLLLFALVAAAGLLVDHRGVPSFRRQVNERWLTTYRGWVYGVGYGVQLGAAWTTTVAASATYLTLAAALLSSSWWGGFLIGLTFGTVRSLPVLGTARVQLPEQLRSLHRRLGRLERPVRLATSTVQAVLGTIALMLFVGLETSRW